MMRVLKLIAAGILLVVSLLAYAADPLSRSPFDYSVLTYLWVIGLSAFGGVVNFMGKMRAGMVRAFNVTEFVGEVMTSALAGLITFWLTEWAQMDKMLSAVLIAVSGHMGARAIFMFEKWAEEKFPKVG